MPVVGHYGSFYGFRDALMSDMPPGSVAFHAQLYPGVYPGDKPYVDALRVDSKAPPLVGEEFVAYAKGLKDRRVLLQRLVVQHGIDEGDMYDPGHLKILQETKLQQDRLEETRVAWYGEQILRLEEACGSHSDMFQLYERGAEAGVPKASFWMSLDGVNSKAPNVIGVMNYRDGDLAYEGVTAWQAPYTPDLETYVLFWLDVFRSASQSTNVADLRVG